MRARCTFHRFLRILSQPGRPSGNCLIGDIVCHTKFCSCNTSWPHSDCRWLLLSEAEGGHHSENFWDTAEQLSLAFMIVWWYYAPSLHHGKSRTPMFMQWHGIVKIVRNLTMVLLFGSCSNGCPTRPSLCTMETRIISIHAWTNASLSVTAALKSALQKQNVAEHLEIPNSCGGSLIYDFLNINDATGHPTTFPSVGNKFKTT